MVWGSLTVIKNRLTKFKEQYFKGLARFEKLVRNYVLRPFPMGLEIQLETFELGNKTKWPFLKQDIRFS